MKNKHLKNILKILSAAWDRADERKLLRPYAKPNLLHLENNSNEVINKMSINNGKNVIILVFYIIPWYFIDI